LEVTNHQLWFVIYTLLKGFGTAKCRKKELKKGPPLQPTKFGN
jgi:hypothetical protein